MGVLAWEKPAKVKSTQAWKEDIAFRIACSMRHYGKDLLWYSRETQGLYRADTFREVSFDSLRLFCRWRSRTEFDYLCTSDWSFRLEGYGSQAEIDGLEAFERDILYIKMMGYFSSS